MRLLYIDNLRGYAILLVVLGHVVQYFAFPDTFDNNFLFRFIYSFHMPLFFIISGLTSKLEGINIERALHNIKRRFVQLICPFVAWYVIAKLFVGEIPTLELFFTPDSGLWFLWVLFWVSLAYQLSMILSYYSRLYPLFFVVVTYIFLRYIANQISLFGTGMVYYYYLYFAIGVVIGIFKNNIPYIKHKYLMTILFFIVSVLLSSFWYRDLANIPSGAPVWVSQLNKTRLFFLLTAIAGSSWVLLLSTYTITEGGAKIGNKTLGIYAIHQVLLWILIGNPYTSELCNILKGYNGWVLLVVFFATILMLTLLIYDLLSYKRFLRIILLGKY